jgi:hypothetical protein
MKHFVLLAVLLAACSGKKGEISGVGPYHFGTHPTTRAAVYDGICQPTELTDGRKATWCFALKPVKIGKHVADVDAYFLGQESEANAKLPEKERKPALEKMPLIEVQFKVRGCVETEAEQWLRERFGPPDVSQAKGAMVVWHNSFIWVGAFLPSEPARCLIHFLPTSESAEIQRIKEKAAGGSSTPPPSTEAGSATSSAPPATAGSAETATGSVGSAQ